MIRFRFKGLGTLVPDSQPGRPDSPAKTNPKMPWGRVNSRCYCSSKTVAGTYPRRLSIVSTSA